MHDKAREAYLKQLERLATETDRLPSPTPGVLEITPEAVVQRVLDATAHEYGAFVQSLLTKEKWAEKYSESYLDGRIRKLLKQRVEEGTDADLDALFDTLVAEHDSYTEGSTVYVPLAGIRMDVPELDFGPVRIRRSDAASIDEMMKSVSVILDGSLSPETTTGALRDRTRKAYEGLGAFAVVQVVAEPTRARERAIQDASRVVDLLRYAIPMLYPADLRVAVSLQSEDLCLRSTSAPIVSCDARSLQIKPYFLGPLHPFEMTPEGVERLKQLGVFRVGEVLRKPASDLTDFERAVMRGIHWFASGVAARRSEDAFLNWITCLETYLTPGRGEPIQMAVGEGTAMILAKGLENRRKLKQRVVRYYRMRCQLSHGGAAEIPESDLGAMRVIAANLTWWMISKLDEFDAIAALQTWLEGRRLSS